MADTYDSSWAEDTVAELARHGVEFACGLGTAELDAIAVSFGVAVPHELELILRVGVPVSPMWARWFDGPDQIAAETRRWIDQSFAFDVEQGQYWHPLLGERPASDAAAVDQALAFLAAAPPLIPIYSHRFITTCVPGPRAVLSVWQPVDSIIYGNDLADYLSREFTIERPSWAASEAPRVPVWEDLFDLFSDKPGPG
jgi:hypothetical protein